MIRWNGWGEETVDYEITKSVENLLKEWVGVTKKPSDISLKDMILKVPDSRLTDNKVITTDKIERIKHSTGQSFSDWVKIRSGENLIFPDAVAFPKSNDEISEILKFAKEENAIIIPYGGGTSVVGHLTVPNTEKPVITVDMGCMNSLINIDKTSNIANFQAGVNGEDLEASLATHGYTLGHYPQSFELSSLGGWIAARSSGQFSSNYGRIENLFAGGNIQTPNGRIELPPFPASAAGPDIRQMLLGSEGRYGLITDAKVRVSPIPQKQEFRSAFFKNEFDAINTVRQLAQAHIPLAMTRLSLKDETESTLSQSEPSKIISALRKYLSFRGAKEEKCLLIYGAVGEKYKVNYALKQAYKIISANSGIYVGSSIGNVWYKGRFHYPYIRNNLWELGYATDTLETANIWSKIPDTVKDIDNSIKESLSDIGEKVYVITHLSHMYSHGSSLYTSYIFRLGNTPKETLERWERIKKAASEAIVKSGGTISHQHGIGLDHAPYLESEKGELGIKMIKNVCSTVDPDRMMNPGKLVD